MLSETSVTATTQRKTSLNTSCRKRFSFKPVAEALNAMESSNTTKLATARKFRDNLGLRIITEGEVPLSMQRPMASPLETPAEVFKIHKIIPIYSFSTATRILDWVEKSQTQEIFQVIELPFPKIYRL